MGHGFKSHCRKGASLPLKSPLKTRTLIIGRTKGSKVHVNERRLVSTPVSDNCELNSGAQ